MISNCCILSCYHCDKLIGLNKKFFSHIWLGIRGGGQDTPAGVLDPQPLICFLKLNKYHMLSKNVVVFHVILVIELIPLV